MENYRVLLPSEIKVINALLVRVGTYQKRLKSFVLGAFCLVWELVCSSDEFLAAFFLLFCHFWGQYLAERGTYCGIARKCSILSFRKKNFLVRLLKKIWKFWSLTTLKYGYTAYCLTILYPYSWKAIYQAILHLCVLLDSNSNHMYLRVREEGRLMKVSIAWLGRVLLLLLFAAAVSLFLPLHLLDHAGGSLHGAKE